MLTRHIQRMLAALCAAAAIGPTSAAMACHEELAQLKHEFSAQQSHLKYTYRGELDAMRHAHKVLLEELRYARKRAHRLCGPQKSAALREINCRQRDAVKNHVHNVRRLNADRRAARHALDADYRSARKSLNCACRATRCAGRELRVPPTVRFSATINKPCLAPSRAVAYPSIRPCT